MERPPEHFRPLDLARHARSVASREVRPGAPLPAHPPGIDASAACPDSPPVVDPTRFGRRWRKPIHAFRYRLARVWTALGILLSAASLTCTTLGDHIIGRWLGLGALLLALLSIGLCLSSRLSARVLGYALAAAVMAFLALVANALFVDLWT